MVWPDPPSSSLHAPLTWRDGLGVPPPAGPTARQWRRAARQVGGARAAERGIMLGPLLYVIAIAGIGATILFSGYTQIMRTNITVQRDNQTKTELRASSITLAASTTLDTTVTPNVIRPPAVLTWASVTTGSLPTSYLLAGTASGNFSVGVISQNAGAKQLDPWSRHYVYCRWTNPPSGPSAPGITLLSAGPDRTLATACSATGAASDDYIERVSVGEVINRANVWQVQSSGDEVRFGLTANPVAVTSTGLLMASRIITTGSITADSLDLTTALPISEGGTGATNASTARLNLGSGTIGDTLFLANVASSARSTLGATTVGDAVFIAATTTAAQTAIGGTAVGMALFTAADAAAGRTTLGATTVGANVFTATTSANARSAIGISPAMDSVVTATTTAAGRTALGASTVGNAVFIASNTGAAWAALNLVTGVSLPVNITGSASSAGSATTAGGLTGNPDISVGNIVASGNISTASGTVTANLFSGSGANLTNLNASNISTGTLAAARLATSGVSAGTYNWGTVDIYGRVTAANNVSVVSSVATNDSNITITDTTTGAGSDGLISFTLEGVVRAVITAGGNMGIGTTSPQERLQVSGGNIRIDGPAATNRQLQYTTTNSLRWVARTNNTVESGSNVGSDFEILRYTDTGALLGTPFSITRSSGAVNIGNANITGGSATLSSANITSATIGGGTATFSTLTATTGNFTTINGAGAVFTGTITAAGFSGPLSGTLTLGASAAATNPRRSGEAGTGLFSDASGVLGFSVSGWAGMTLTHVSGFGQSGGNLGIWADNSRSVTISPHRAATGTSGLITVSAFNNGLRTGLDLNNVNSDASAAMAIIWSLATDASTTPITAGRVYVNKVQNWTSSASTQDSNLIFEVANDGTLAERMRITATGGVGIGTTAPTERLTVNGNIDLITAANARYMIGGVNAVAIPSLGSTVVGDTGAATATTASLHNTSVGYQALNALTTGFHNTAVGYQALRATRTAAGNSAFGYLALTALTSGGGNIAVGNAALDAAQNADNNTAVGSIALGDFIGVGNTVNVALGRAAMQFITSGSDNTALGGEALRGLTGGGIDISNNVAIGRAALVAIVTGANNNIAVGRSAGDNISTGANNIVIGHDVNAPSGTSSSQLNIGNLIYGDLAGAASALTTLSTGAAVEINSTSEGFLFPRLSTTARTSLGSTITGGLTIYNTTSGSLQWYDGTAWQQPLTTASTGSISATIALGSTATATNPQRSGEAGTGLFSPATGVVAIATAGTEAVRVTATNSMGIGTATVTQALTVSGNVDLVNAPNARYLIGGNNAIAIPSSGSTIVGATNAAQVTTTTLSNTVVGFSALNALTTGIRNVAIGSGALTANTVGSSNVAIGFNALVANNTGFGNVAVGQQAINNQLGGYGNVGIGLQAMFSSVTGLGNVAIGRNALNDNVTGNYNVAIGQSALAANLNSSSVAIGVAALEQNVTGLENVALGVTALRYNLVGDYNVALGGRAMEGADNTFHSTAVGYSALRNLQTGANNNIAVGYQAGEALTSGANNIIIGYDIDAPVATANSQLNIGNLIYGDIASAASALTLLNTGAAVAINSTTEGFLFPRLTTTARTTLGSTITSGLTIYNTTSGSLQWYDGTAWQQPLTTASTGSISATIALGSTATATNPQRSGEAGTGLFSPATGIIALSITGNEIVRFTATNTGFGTNNPRRRVHVVGPGGVSATSFGNGNVGLIVENNGQSFISIAGNNDIVGLLFGETGVGAGAFGQLHYNLADNSMRFITNQSERLRIMATGGVGIGTSTPTQLLTVSGNIDLVNATNARYMIGGSNAIALPSSGSTIVGATNAATVTTTGLNNTVVGSLALNALTTGVANVAVGESALLSLTTGVANTALGGSTLVNLIGGLRNTAIGEQAMFRLSAGDWNTSVGENSMLFVVSGTGNVALGQSAMEGVDGQSRNNSNNVAIGRLALTAILTGASGNTAVGYAAGDNLTAGSLNILIGNGTDAPRADGSSQLNIGNLVYGNIASAASALTATSTGAAIEINSTTAGLLLPRLTTVSRTAIAASAPSGLTIYNTTSGSLQWYDGTNWVQPLSSASTGSISATIALGSTATATNPQRSGEAGTGLFSPASGTIAFSVTGNEVMRITPTGNVGINSANPTNMFEVRSSNSPTNRNFSIARTAALASPYVTIMYSDNGSVAPAMTFQNIDTTVANKGNALLWQLSPDGSNTISSGRINVASEQNWTTTASTQDSYMGFWTAINGGMSEAMRITSSGSLGIGTTTPTQMLTVSGNIDLVNAANTRYMIGGVNAVAIPALGSTVVGDTNAATNTTASLSTVLGYQALHTHTGGGTRNVAVGRFALGNLITGSVNTAVGNQSAPNLINGTGNTALGDQSLFSLTSGVNNVALGQNAMLGVGTGNSNIAVGAGALNGSVGLTTANSANVAIGSNALFGVRTGASNNIALGWQAGENISTGSNNIIIGNNVLAPSAVGSSQLNVGNLVYGNIASAAAALTATSTGAAVEINSTSAGFLFPRLTTVSRNAIAASAPSGLTIYNTTSGSLQWYDGTAWVQPLTSSFTGSLAATTILGTSTSATNPQRTGEAGTGLFSPATGVVAIATAGTEAVRVTATNSVGIGTATVTQALTVSGNIDLRNTTNPRLLINGSNAIAEPSTGTLVVGDTDAATITTTGLNNTALGFQAMHSMTTAVFTTVALGNQALLRLTSGNQNSALGENSLLNILTGSANTAIGHTAMAGAVGAAGVGFNTAIGRGAMLGVGTGALGNIALGFRAASTLTGGDYNIIIGYNAEPTSPNASSQINIGDLIYGDTVGAVGLAALSTGAALEINSSTKGFLFPRLTTTARTSLGSTITGGLTIYNTTSGSLQWYDGTSWVQPLTNTFTGTLAATVTFGGSEAATSPQRTGEAGTGFFSSTSGFINAASGGTEVLRINSLGLSRVGATTGSATISVGAGATASRAALIEFIGDTTYTGYGLRIIRNNTGANATSQMLHRGTGALNFETQEAAPITFTTSGTEAVRITATRSMGIGTNTPTQLLTVSGNIDLVNAANTRYLIGGSNAVAVPSATSVIIGPTNAATVTAVNLDNTAVGASALNALTTGTSMVAVGYLALSQNNTGVSNTAIGTEAMRFNVTGSRNTAYGTMALRANLASDNLAFGERALLVNQTGASNVAVGGRAMANLIFGQENIALGNLTINNVVTGSQNVAIGSQSMFSVGASSLSRNTAVGYRSLYVAGTGADNNIALGFQAGDALTSGANNIIIGYDIDAPSATGSSQLNIGNLVYGNIASAASALTATSTGAAVEINSTSAGFLFPRLTTVSRTAIAASAPSGLTIYNTTSGSLQWYDGTSWVQPLTNTFTGSLAATIALGSTGTATNPQRSGEAGTGLFSPATGVVAIASGGTEAVRVTATRSVAIGTSTATQLLTVSGGNIDIRGGSNPRLLINGDNAIAEPHLGTLVVGDTAAATVTTTGLRTTALGYFSLNAVTTGSDNTALGYQTLRNNTTGYDNAAIGTNAMLANIGGNLNSALGNATLQSNTYGNRNTAVGRGAMAASLTASDNTAVGVSALFNIQADNNTAVGIFAMVSSVSGTFNTAVGSSSLRNNLTGSYNVAFGDRAMIYDIHGVDNTALGALALYGVDGASSSRNVAVGRGAMQFAGTGSDNNIVIGWSAASNMSGGDNNIIIGHNINPPSNSGSSQLNIGNLIYGDIATAASALTLLNTGAAVAINSTTEGFLFPRLTTVSRTAIAASAPSGLTIYNTTSGSLQWYDGTSWVQPLTNTFTGSLAATIALGSTGTATNPQRTGEAGTGLFSSASNRVGVAVGGTTVAVFGNTDPLTVTTTANLQSTGLQAASPSGGYITLVPDASSGSYSSVVRSGDTAIIFTDSTINTGNLVIAPWNNIGAGLRMTNTGSVGIGTSFPTQLLTVSGNVDLINAPNARYMIGGVNAVAIPHSATLVLGNTNAATNTGVNRFATAVGHLALNALTAGNDNTAIGYNAMAAQASGSNNTALGRSAMAANVTNNNTAVGAYSLAANTSGLANTALGYLALSANITGGGNVAIGSNAMSSGIRGESNVAVGFGALADSVGNRNTAIGDQSMVRLVTGDFNSALGENTLDQLALGSNNTAIGRNALSAIVTGNSNIALGMSAGANITTGNSNIIIGSSINAPSATGNSQLNIGGLVYGNIASAASALTATSTGAAVEINSTTAGLLLPRLTTVSRTAIPASAPSGLTIYNTTSGSLQWYDGTSWVQPLTNTFTGSLAATIALGSTGTATNPQRTGEAGTGLFSPASGIVSTAVNGSEIIRTTASGLNIMAGRLQLPIGSTTTPSLQFMELSSTGGLTAISDGIGFVSAGTTRWTMSPANIRGNGLAAAAIQNTSTEGQPAFTFVSDSDAGMFRPANDVIAFSTSGTEKIRITAAGSLGIGTASPTQLLTVSGNVDLVSGNNPRYMIGGNNVVALPSSGSTIVGATNAATATTAALNNTAVGFQAMNSLTTGTENVGVGYRALFVITTGLRNVAIGSTALDALTTGNNNVAIGNGALTDNVRGSSNIAIGHRAGENSTGDSNTMIGNRAMMGTTIGTENIALGNDAMVINNTGFNNIAIGTQALRNLTSGGFNIAIGNDAMLGNAGANNFGSNTAIGYQALTILATGGNNNIAFGFRAGNNITTGTDNIVIGYDVDAPSGTSSSQLNIGNLIYGDVASAASALTLLNTGAAVAINSTTEGFLFPRLTTTARTSLGSTITGGLTIYNTTSGSLQWYDGTAWVQPLTSSFTGTLAATTTLGTSASATSPQRTGEAGTGLFSNASGVLGFSVSGQGVMSLTATNFSGQNNGIFYVGGSNSRYVQINPLQAAIGAEGMILANANNNGVRIGLNLQNTNADSGAGMSMVWNFGTDVSSTPIQAGRVLVVKAQNWTSTTSTQDSNLIFEVANDGTLAERMRITATGGVGIGTNAPSALLSVGTGLSGVGHSNIFSANAGDLGTTAGDTLRLASIGFMNAGQTALGIKARRLTSVGTWDNTAIGLLYDIDSLSPANNMQLWMTANGFLGIGSNSHNANTLVDIRVQDALGAGSGLNRLRVAAIDSAGAGGSALPAIEVMGARGDGNTTFYGRLAAAYRRTDGTAIASGNPIGAVTFGAQHGTSTSFVQGSLLYPASIKGIAEGSFTNATTMPTGIGFFTGSTGDDLNSANLTYGTERMRITATGSVGIGTSTPTQMLTVSGNINAVSATNPRYMIDGNNAVAAPSVGSLIVGQSNAATVTAASLFNTAVGYQALNAVTTGVNNVAIGYRAQFVLTTGARNIAIGSSTLDALTTGVNNIAIGNAALTDVVGGSSNVAIGVNALGNLVNADGNVAIGENAMISAVSLTNSVAIGEGAMYTSVANGNNTAVGFNAMYSLDVGTGNVAIGYWSQRNASGSVNTSVGSMSLHKSVGQRNTAIGEGTMYDLITGDNNSAMGENTLEALVTGNGNTGIGRGALILLTSGNNNTALGMSAGDNLTFASSNIAIGANIDPPSATANSQLNIGNLLYGNLASAASALTATSTGAAFEINSTTAGFLPPRLTTTQRNAIPASTTGGLIIYNTTSAALQLYNGTVWQQPVVATMTGSVGIGTASPTHMLTVAGDINITSTNRILNRGAHLISLPSANNSIAAGTAAGTAYTGEENTGFGSNTLRDTTTGNQNTAIGAYALIQNTIGAENTAIGRGTMFTSTSGYRNTAVGLNALFANTNASDNTAVGWGALAANTTGSQNTAIGRGALLSNTIGSNNTAIGFNALSVATIGTQNTALGWGALQNSTTSANTALGERTLNASVTGARNVAIGQGTLQSATQSDNTAVGQQALTALVGGSNNVAIGRNAGGNQTAGSDNIVIGAGVNLAVTTGSNQINIGNVIYGDRVTNRVGLNTTTLNYALTVGTSSSNGNGAYVTNAGVWTDISDARTKTSVVDIDYGLATLMRLRPVRYEMNETHEKQIGFIAQEVRAVVPEVVSIPSTAEGKFGLSYGQLGAVTVRAVQELKGQLDETKAALTALQGEHAALLARVSQLEAKLATTAVAPAANDNAPTAAPLLARDPNALIAPNWLLWLAGGMGGLVLLGGAGMGFMLWRLSRKLGRLEEKRAA